ncbi:MAG: hypothetical protein RR540_01225 [Oscillospiraceae bacterium]
MENENLLEQLNAFTRREHTNEEVYIFSVILCDNEVDRDDEKFTLAALNKMKELFVGKTGIFDHNAKGSNQTARIFSTEVVETPEKLNSTGEKYTCLKANAYMIRTNSNADLIKEIDGGIKKEVSVSCNVSSKKCSVCGADLTKKVCSHIKGKIYNEKKCFAILDDVTDAYEWSFVAVPAQKNAGVTKKFSGEEMVEVTPIQQEILEKIFTETKQEVLRLGFLVQPKISAKSLEKIAERMSLSELYDLKKSFMAEICGDLSPQISSKYPEKNALTDSFKMA